MTHDPNQPPAQRPDQQHWHPPQFGQYPQQGAFGSNQPYPPQQAKQPHFAPPGFPPPPAGLSHPRKGPFGASFWIVSTLLAVLVLVNMMLGRGEAILIILGIAAALTGLISMGSERRTWANLPNRKFAMSVCLAGVASVLVGSVAAGTDASHDARIVREAQPATSAELEAAAAAKLKAREDALAKSEAESAAKLKAREDAVTARETAARTAESKAAVKSFGQGVWTVGKDIEPGDYKTTKTVVGDCSWKITRTGSNGGDYIDYDFSVSGGRPMVSLVEGQTFDSDGCGDWAKQ
ncbi:hypothetical protein [Arthrobacter sp. QXT-31]|uniref:hypothetical protein n=1 Tax=Arthrobacter sp. QXT-31 TaxID=1357915 RepID=UPI0012F73515|nr:hypothetical protein [Arthrobacter sp. QXT-31]